VSTEDADLLARLAQRGPVEVELFLGARQLADAPSANAIGELRGRELPDEIVLLGAHMDSWDVGQGASDDGAGCVAIMDALRLLRASGLAPRRTVRVVLFTGEEYGLAGARAYQQRHGGEHHVAAFETDYGMAAPDAIGVGSEARVEAMAPLLPAFARFDIRRFLPHAYGADVAADRRRRRARLRPRAGRPPLLRHPPHRRLTRSTRSAGGSAPQRRRHRAARVPPGRGVRRC
jgi:Zn-dependent M28 family amino/carboxypeptidase